LKGIAPAQFVKKKEAVKLLRCLLSLLQFQLFSVALIMDLLVKKNLNGDAVTLFGRIRSAVAR
jgi:hypothetical protein